MGEADLQYPQAGFVLMPVVLIPSWPPAGFARF